MKKITLALTALGLSVGAFAALPAATDPTLVSVPQLHGGLVIGGSGFYLQSTYSNGDLDYAAVNTATSASNSSFFASSLKNVDPGYDWGWGVNVGYIFPNTGNDINLSYLQLNTSDTAAVSNNNSEGSVSTLGNNVNFMNFFNEFLRNPTSFANAASAKAEYNLNQVDLTAGQYINVGCRLSLHPFAGLRWAGIERKLNSAYSVNATGITAPSVTITDILNQNVSFAEKSDFQGIGPIAGIDASYYVGLGFGIIGHFDSALLIGNIDVTTNEAVREFALSQDSIGTFLTGAGTGAVNFNAGNTRRIVPVLDAKLGADYTYVFNNAANSDLTLEAGWMVSNYFNAIDRLQTDTTLLGPSAGNNNSLAIDSPVITGRITSDFAIQGPYVSLVAHV